MTDLLVTHARIRMPQRALMISLGSQLAGLALLARFGPDLVPAHLLPAMTVLHTGIVFAFLLALGSARRWRGGAVDGLGWLTLTFLLAPNLGQQEHYVLFCLCLASCTVSMFSIGASWPVYVLRVAPIVTGFAYVQATRPPPAPPLLLGATLLCALIIALAFHFHRLVLQTAGQRRSNRELIARLSEQTRLAGTLAQSRARFLATASHDLRQPVHALSLCLEAMAQASCGAHWQTSLANASRCAQSMDHLFAALLDVSQLESCHGPVAHSRFPVQPLLERIGNEFAPQAAARGLALRVAPCRGWILSDPALAERMLRKLVGNAIARTERGTVLVGCRRRGKLLEFQVCDTGVGIAPDQQRLVLEEYNPAHRERPASGQGPALGLALVRRIATLLGSQLRRHSIPGRGNCFAFSATFLPVRAVSRAALCQPQAGNAALHDRLILVIDADPTILNASRALLERWGCQVLTAYSGAHAAAQVRAMQRRPDAMVCERQLKDEDGVAAILAVARECGQPIPALLVTGDTASPRPASGSELALPLLHKPVAEHQLQAALARLISDAPQRIKEFHGTR